MSINPNLYTPISYDIGQPEKLFFDRLVDQAADGSPQQLCSTSNYLARNRIASSRVLS
jgi:hypothetical protein